MDSIRKWFNRPKRDDTSLLAKFFYADESLNAVACELDSFDGRQEPERCTTLVNQLRHCQDKVLTICNQIMDDLIPDNRANRDFRVKFPDDVMQENLAGQLWFGAECLAAGSSIINREAESSAMRPLAKALTKSLEIVRNLLRDHALKGHMNLKAQNPLEPSLEKLIESLKIFDRLFADFELSYVGAMVPVKSTKEYEQQELVCVLFSETLQRALERGLLSQSDVDNYEPALMFTIPRLAIVSGLLAPPGGPLCLNSAETLSEMFRPFRTLLLKIRELLWTLNNRELYMLEKLLCSNEEPSAAPITSNSHDHSTTTTTTTTTTMTTTTNNNNAKLSNCQDYPDLEEFVNNFYTGYPNCKEFIIDFYTVTNNTGNNMDEVANDAVQILDDEDCGIKAKPRNEGNNLNSENTTTDNFAAIEPRTNVDDLLVDYRPRDDKTIRFNNNKTIINTRPDNLISPIDHPVRDNIINVTDNNSVLDSRDSNNSNSNYNYNNSNSDDDDDDDDDDDNDDNDDDDHRRVLHSDVIDLNKLINSVPNRRDESIASLNCPETKNNSEEHDYTVRNNLTSSSDVASELNTPAADDEASKNDESRRGNSQGREDTCLNSSDISQILGAPSESIEVSQTQYLLNQVSHENNVTVDGGGLHLQNSLPDIDSKKLISEANKTLSNLLSDNDCSHNNEISEQTDSGICTVISSENTSLYDKSPEEKRAFPRGDVQRRNLPDEDLEGKEVKVKKEEEEEEEEEEDEDEEQEEDEDEDADDDDDEENTSYSCSKLNSPKRKNSNISENSCVCSLRSSTKTVGSLDGSTEIRSLNSGGFEVSKNIPKISSNFDGTNEEFVGLAYGAGQLSVCDSNQTSFQINYSENWENLNINIDASTSRNEFWNDLKCENCPSTSKKSIDNIGKKIERYAHEKIIAVRKLKGENNGKQQRRRYFRKSEMRRNGFAGNGSARRDKREEEEEEEEEEDEEGEEEGEEEEEEAEEEAEVEEEEEEEEEKQTRKIRSLKLQASNESSRSNSTDRGINSRFASFGATLHPSQNTRQIPSFGSHSPHMSPRLHHFETRVSQSTQYTSTSSSIQKSHNRNTSSSSSSLQSRKLFDQRKSRSDHLARIKRRVGESTKHQHQQQQQQQQQRGERQERVVSASTNAKIIKNALKEASLINDGLGRRTDKSGLPSDPLDRSTSAREATQFQPQSSREIFPPVENSHRVKMRLVNPSLMATAHSTSLERVLVQRKDIGSTSSCSSCCDSSSETSEFQSDCQDDEEIALAMQAAEIANRNQIRAKFRSSEDLVHRLFVCIAGVADQLQTNFASDLRNILKCVFLMNSSQTPEEPIEPVKTESVDSFTQSDIAAPIDTEELPDNTEQQEIIDDRNEFEQITPSTNERISPITERGEECVERAPAWIPDQDAPRCMACHSAFTVVKRRHHCRNCGKVFCGRCSNNNVPLPRYGHTKPVRVCNRCFLYQVTPFTVTPVTVGS